MDSLMENSYSSVNAVNGDVTFYEITGGNIQTTSLRVKLNGVFVGKFNNATRSMAKNNKDFASSVLPSMKILGYVIAGKDKPHAEDYMILYFHDNAKDSKFKKTDIVSIAMDKSPCIVCAQNLVKFSQNFGFSLRIKAGFHFEATKKRGVPKGQHGVDYLEDNDIPIRAWPLANIAEKMKAKISDVNDKVLPRYETSFSKFKLSSSVIGIFDKYDNKKIGWKSVGYSRSQAHDAQLGKNWKFK